MNTQKPLAQKTINGLLAIAAAVLADPKMYNQDNFAEKQFGSDKIVSGCLAFFHSRLTSTERGHALRVKKFHAQEQGMGTNVSFFHKAQRDLKLSDEQARVVFGSVYEWPYKFRNAYHDAKGPKSRARVAERRIKRFIKTNGAE